MNSNTITITILLFSSIAEQIGKRRNEVTIAAGATVADVLQRLQHDYDLAQNTVASIATAVNEQYVSREHVLQANDVLALIPPVSGG